MGATPAVFGLAGSYVAFIVINYTYLRSRSDKLYQIIVFILLSVFLVMTLGFKH